MKTQKARLATSLAALLIGRLACSGTAKAQHTCPAPPALTAPSGTNIFDPRQELELGDVQAEWLEKNYKIIRDDELTARLNLISSRILAQLPPTQLKFRIILIDLPTVNSFSVGAGRIYMTRKMVAFLRNDDELTGLLGHEMGHILTHQQAIEMTQMFHDILGVTSVGDHKDIFDKYNRMLDNIARDRSVLLRSAERVRREEEPHQYEADRVALYAVGAAGYSPQGLADLFDRLSQTHGKTGNLLTDIFGATKPNEKRLREMHKSLNSLPQTCRDIAISPPSTEFLEWQAEVVAHSGLGREERLVGTVSKKALEPPLRSDIENVKFSPNGEYALAQDDASIFVFKGDPFTFLFRIDATDAQEAQFSPDSRKIIFLTRGLRIEEWTIDDEERTSVHEMALPEGCLRSALSHDGKVLACVNRQFDLSLIDVDTGNPLLTEKAYFAPRAMDRSAELTLILIYIWTATGDGRWIQMGFSPDDHYFAATGAGLGIGVDVAKRSRMPLHGALGGMLTANFAFLGPERVLVQNAFDPKNSAVMEFSSGKVVEHVPINPRQQIEVPTRGNYVILKPVKDAKVGLLDLETQKFLIGSTQSTAMDVYDREVLIQKASGEVGVFDLSTHERKGQVELPKSSLGSLRAWAASPDLKWLAVSGTTRGAVWDLESSKRLYYTRGFRGGYFDGDQTFYADFPKHETQGRTIARAGLMREEIVPGVPVDEKAVAQQEGQVLLVRKPLGKDNFRNIELEVMSVKDGRILWSRSFPKEVPGINYSQQSDAVVFVWNAESIAAKDEIKSSESLQSRLAAVQDRKGAYLLEIVNAADGKLRGQLLIDTVKGSFRVTRTMAEGDWVLVGDNENRTRVYSLTGGEQKATLFGTYAMCSSAAGILVVENESSQIDVYDLKSFDKRAVLTFPDRVSAWSFSADGKRLLVLTANQIAYIFDSASLEKQNATVATAP